MTTVSLNSAFFDLLREIRQGAVVSELGAELSQLVTEVRATGKPGSIVLTLEVKPVKNGGVDTMVITDTVKVKPPKYERTGTILYATEQGELTRQDSRQPELSGLREIGRRDERQAVNE